MWGEGGVGGGDRGGFIWSFTSHPVVVVETEGRQEPLVFLQCCKYSVLPHGRLLAALYLRRTSHYCYSKSSQISMFRLRPLQGLIWTFYYLSRRRRRRGRENVILSLSALASLASLDFNPSSFFREIFSKTSKQTWQPWLEIINIWYFSTDPCPRTSLRSAEACPPCSPTTMRNRHRTTFCLLHVSNLTFLYGIFWGRAEQEKIFT